MKKKKKKKLPKQRITFPGNLGTRVHSHGKDYNRKKEKEKLKNEYENTR